MRSLFRILLLGALAALATAGPVGMVEAGASAFEQLTGRNVKNGTLTGADVKDGTLQARDFKAGQLPAGPQGEPGPPGREGAAGAKGPPGAPGAPGAAGDSPFLDVGIEWASNRRSLSDTTFQTVPFLSTTIEVPPGKTATVLATYSAASACTGGAAGGKCLVRIVLDDAAMDPPGDDAVFDSVDDGGTPTAFDSGSIVRSRTGVGPGTHTVAVQAATRGLSAGDPEPTVTLAMNSLVVQAIEE